MACLRGTLDGVEDEHQPIHVRWMACLSQLWNSWARPPNYAEDHETSNVELIPRAALSAFKRADKERPVRSEFSTTTLNLIYANEVHANCPCVLRWRWKEKSLSRAVDMMIVTLAITHTVLDLEPCMCSILNTYNWQSNIDWCCAKDSWWITVFCRSSWDWTTI